MEKETLFIGNTSENLLKGFYMDTSQNRKLGRVGQQYDIVADFTFGGIIKTGFDTNELVVRDKSGAFKRKPLNEEDNKKLAEGHFHSNEEKDQLIQKYFGEKVELTLSEFLNEKIGIENAIDELPVNIEIWSEKELAKYPITRAYSEYKKKYSKNIGIPKGFIKEEAEYREEIIEGYLKRWPNKKREDAVREFNTSVENMKYWKADDPDAFKYAMKEYDQNLGVDDISILKYINIVGGNFNVFFKRMEDFKRMRRIKNK